MLRTLRAGPTRGARLLVTGLPLVWRNSRTEKVIVRAGVSVADRTTTVVEIHVRLCKVLRTSTVKKYGVPAISGWSVLKTPLETESLGGLTLRVNRR